MAKKRKKKPETDSANIQASPGPATPKQAKAREGRLMKVKL